MSQLVAYERPGPVATITMDDGKVNAMSSPILTALHDAFDRAERDRAVVVLTGRAGMFSAGFDLKVFARGDVGEIRTMMKLGADGPFRIGLNEVAIGLTVPGFGIEVARQRLTPPTSIASS